MSFAGIGVYAHVLPTMQKTAADTIQELMANAMTKSPGNSRDPTTFGDAVVGTSLGCLVPVLIFAITFRSTLDYAGWWGAVILGAVTAFAVMVAGCLIEEILRKWSKSDSDDDMAQK